MKLFFRLSFSFLLLVLTAKITNAQLIITPASTQLELAQKLVGDGVSISNVQFSGNLLMTGFFQNRSGTQISIDSGIVLTNGRAKSDRATNRIGVDGNGTNIAYSNPAFANNEWNLPGDADLNLVVTGGTKDACVLEFDFIPLGDSIKFNYVFSSEEYPEFSCPATPGDQNYNDVFGFFIDGPGFPARTNIALIPSTTFPVTINNINDDVCALFPQYYVNNENNRSFTHNGHTKVFTAVARVQPCQTYHLKLVIADVVDAAFDSGVFLQARSLTSNAVGMTNLTQTDPGSGESYLVEGCITGAFNIRRPRKDPFPLVVNLSYGGNAVNGVDYQLLPSSVIIPANDSFVTVNLNPIVDGLPEGIEEIRVYALAGCASGTPTDSTIIQIRDYDILDLTPDTAFICKNGSIQLTATTGYASYQWQADPTLSSTVVRDPVATPVNSTSTYICTATLGTCNARDSVFLQWKDIEFISKTDVNCRNATDGQIRVAGGAEWPQPVQFSIDGVNWQPDSTFNNLAAGAYWVKIRNGSCIDSILVTVNQAYPDLVISSFNTTPASCSGDADGTIQLVANGGNASYSYSLDGINFQSSPTFNIAAGNVTVTVQDGNGCKVQQSVFIPVNNTVTVDAGSNQTICEGTSIILPATSNASAFAWTPATSLTNPSVLTPAASPSGTTRYYLTATTGICNAIDSIDISVRPAPIADAGTNIDICYGKTFSLQGNGGVQFEWSPVTNFVAPSTSTTQNPTVKALTDINYSLYVKDIFDCRSLNPAIVRVNVTPSVKLFAGRDTIAAMGQPIQLTVRETGNAGVTTYSWTPSFPMNDASSAKPIVTLQADQRFIVTGTTPDGCQGMDDIVVKVYKGPEIYVGTGFTPNGDGKNDELIPVAVGIREFRSFSIYNRWGQLIYSSRNPQRGWNGTFNGQPQPTGTYVWMAEAVDYQGNLLKRKGVVTIIR